MASESTRERRERLDAITARIASRQYTPEDVSWLREIADEYISHWERNLAKLRRKTQEARSTAWPAGDDAVQERRGRRGRTGG